MVVVVRARRLVQAHTSVHANRFYPRSALDTAHVTLSWHMIYYYLILNFDNRDALKDSVWCAQFTLPVTLCTVLSTL